MKDDEFDFEKKEYPSDEQLHRWESIATIMLILGSILAMFMIRS